MTLAPLQLPFVSEARVRELSATLGEPGWLLDDRLDAVRRVAELPAEGNPLFTPYLDLRIARFGAIEAYGPAADAGVGAPLPDGAAALLHVREDRVVAAVVRPDLADAGVVVGALSDVLATRPDLVRSMIEGGASLPSSDAFAQVARAASSVGAVIHVPDGLAIEDPIVVRWTAGAGGRGLISRTLVSIGASAHARLLEEQVGSGSDDAQQQTLWWGTLELSLGAGASLAVAGEQDLGVGTVGIVSRQARVERDASLDWAMASIGGALFKSRIDNVLAGRGASVRQVEIGFGSGQQLFDLTSYTHHVAEDTTGDLLSKGVFLDRARGYFKGLIRIERTARGTDSFLGEFAMLLDRKARSVAIPSLEIDQPDVRRAAHSSSVGPIDEQQLFYLMTRGLGMDEARRAIVLGFLEPVVARIPLPQAQDRLRRRLEEKWPSAAAKAA